MKYAYLQSENINSSSDGSCTVIIFDDEATQIRLKLSGTRYLPVLITPNPNIDHFRVAVQHVRVFGYRAGESSLDEESCLADEELPNGMYLGSYKVRLMLEGEF